MKAKAEKPKNTAQLPLFFVTLSTTEKLQLIKTMLEKMAITKKFSQANKILAMYKELNNNK